MKLEKQQIFLFPFLKKFYLIVDGATGATHTAYTYVLPSYLNEIISMKYISMRREN